MASHRCGKKVCAIHIDSKELAKTIHGVVSGLEVFGEASRGHQVVNLAMTGQDLSDAGVNAILVRDVGVVGSDLGGPKERGKREVVSTGWVQVKMKTTWKAQRRCCKLTSSHEGCPS